MIGIIVATFVASFIGSVHCVGMCGPFAMLAGATRDEESKNASLSVFSRGMLLAFIYNLGRLVTYLVFGIIAGLLGIAIDFSGQSLGIQQLAIYFAGGTLVVAGLIGILRNFGLQKFTTTKRFSVTPFLSRGIQRIRRHRPAFKAWLLGMITSLMPCGWLYFFVLAASTTQSVVTAPLVMFFFWLGTLPVLQFLGSFAGLVAGLRTKVNWIIPVLMLCVGSYSLVCRSPVELVAAEVAESKDPAGSIRSLDPTTAPCCCHDDNF